MIPMMMTTMLMLPMMMMTTKAQLVETADSCQESGECAKMCRSSLLGRLSGGANSKFLNLGLSLLYFWDDCSFNILKDIFLEYVFP